MKSCFALPWHIFPIIMRTICTCCLRMFSCVSWPHPVLLCTPIQTNYLLFFLCLHPCWNWSWGLASRRPCLVWPSFAIPLRYRCLNQISYLCYWRQTQILSRNIMLDWLIPRKITILYYFLCVAFPLSRTSLASTNATTSTNHLCSFHHYQSFFAVITDLPSNFDDNS